MRLVNTPIVVQTDPDGAPTAFVYRGHTYRVESVVDRWRYMGRWWLGEGEWRFWRVLAGGGVFEILYDVVVDEWRLYRIYD